MLCSYINAQRRACICTLNASSEKRRPTTTKERVCHVSEFYPENADKEVSRVATRSAVNTTSSPLFKDIQTKMAAVHGPSTSRPSLSHHTDQ